jgi:glycosyltransferase involved in cell wall biosynthesis
VISVVIATKNRSEAVSDISLPSLLRQDVANFEILIWDASDDELTKEAVDRRRSLFEEREIALLYRRAPRVGLASQRNDALLEAKGDIVFFIDDDSEVSSDGLRSIDRHFSDFGRLMGLGLPLTSDEPSVAGRYAKRPVVGAARGVIRFFFRGAKCSYRKIRNSTMNIFTSADRPGVAEWLTGASMAFRKSVFEKLRFDERLELFGGYAFGEDYDLSHRVFLHYKEPLLIASSGFVVHHPAKGGRIADNGKKAAAMFYNTAVIRTNFRKYGNYGLLSFIWELRFGLIISMFEQGMAAADICRGYFLYRRALREQRRSIEKP